MRRWLLVVVSLALTVLNGTPAWAVSGLPGRGPSGGALGFGGHSAMGFPTIRRPSGSVGAVGPRGMGPSAMGHGAAVVGEESHRGDANQAVRLARPQPVQPKLIIVDPSGRTQILRSTGSVITGPRETLSNRPQVITLSHPGASSLIAPKVIEVHPTRVARPVVPKVIMVKALPVSRHHGRRVIGTALDALGTTLLLGEPCEPGVGLAEICAPDDSSPLTVEATPEDAEVFLDGQLLGRAGELSAQTVVIAPGRHGLEIARAGVDPFRLEFTAAPSTPTRVHAALAAR
jgi:hypothetical protein